MGRVYRKQAMGILNLLKKMQDGVQRAIQCNNMQSAGQLLSEMQEAAITLGTSIEAHIGEGSGTVKAVEEYCELIYQLYDGLGQQGELEAIEAALYDQWQKIHLSAEEELSSRYEMVFLPYKVSMWDSLESVWRAAAEDPDCDAYVIPIPYYDKNPDGTFRSEHYEGGEFPEDVPITHYLEYDFERKHPDVIFIHNPYDDQNFVTSVHPYFYTQKLKEFTEKLVYIPYYVSAEINPDSEDAIEGKAGMTLLNGVLNSDMVFLQSENTKRLFVNILERYIQNADRSYWENKIWGLGSPKMDRVNRVVRDDARLPQNWHDVIYTESGLRKKVVFYNISISTLLNNPDMLNKIRDVLMFFKNSKDVVLWWRPHPLYESTLASMRPDMLAEYQQIVNQYKQDGWGIFDDGVDLEWAIAETDAYYGDKSSVVQLYKEAGKPIMIQDVTVRSQQEVKAEDIPIWPSAFCVDGEDIWFVHGKINVLMRYNMREEHTYIVGAISDKVEFRGKLYCGMHKWKNKIFIIPCWAKEIIVYDIDNNQFQKILIDNSEAYFSKILFIKSYMKEEVIYCVPCHYHAIVKIDVKNNQVIYVTIALDVNVHINDAVWVNNKIIGIYSCTDQLLVYDSKTDAVNLIRMGNSERQYNRITNIDDFLYLFDTHSRAIFEVSGEMYDKEKKICDTSYEGAGVTAISSELLLVDSAQGYEMKIVNINGEIIFETENNHSVRIDDLFPVAQVGIASGDLDSNDLFYFSVATYNMNHLKCGKLEKQFNMSMRDDDFYKLKKLCTQGLYDEISENNIYDLTEWIHNLHIAVTRESDVGKNCGEEILKVVKDEG